MDSKFRINFRNKVSKKVIFKNEYTIKNISKIVRLDRGSVRFVSTI